MVDRGEISSFENGDVVSGTQRQSEYQKRLFDRAFNIQNDEYLFKMDVNPRVLSMVQAMCGVPFKEHVIRDEVLGRMKLSKVRDEEKALGNVNGFLAEAHLGRAFSLVANRGFRVTPVEAVEDEEFRLRNPRSILNVVVEKKVTHEGAEKPSWISASELDGFGLVDGHPFVIEVKTSPDPNNKNGVFKAMTPKGANKKILPLIRLLGIDQISLIILTLPDTLSREEGISDIFRKRGGIVGALNISRDQLNKASVDILRQYISE